MTITLYKNSQYEADTPKSIYKDQWSIVPYEPADMFCVGETTAQQEFVIPVEITYNTEEKVFKHNGVAPCTISTNEKGQPVLSVSYMKNPFVLLTPEEHSKLPVPEKKKSTAWIPGYDKNGELEIF